MKNIKANAHTNRHDDQRHLLLSYCFNKFMNSIPSVCGRLERGFKQQLEKHEKPMMIKSPLENKFTQNIKRFHDQKIDSFFL